MTKQFRKIRSLVILRLSLLCLSVVADSNKSTLPLEAVINHDAGRGNFIFVTLHSETGEALPFLVDTGSPITVLDKTYESKLGKRLKTGTMWLGSTKQQCGVYLAPKLYLANTLLLTGSNVLTYDFTKAERHTTWAKHHSMYLGILGMDCLKNYCVQFDFDAGKIRFLDFGHLDTTKLGNSFPLKFQGGHIYLEHTSLLGGSNTNALIDTGWNIEGRAEKGSLKKSGSVHLPKCIWDGVTYTNLDIQVGENANVLGLKFLARHLVTFDFPNKRIFLKQTSIGPLMENNSDE